jgi:hypothetical protein
MKPKKIDLAYTAGLMDGEGSVSLAVQGNTLRIEVSCSQNTRTALDWLEKIYGGAVYEYKPKGRNSSIFNWKIYGEKAIEFLLLIRPYMIIKSWNAEQAISIWEAKHLGQDWTSKVEFYRTTMREEREAR